MNIFVLTILAVSLILLLVAGVFIFRLNRKIKRANDLTALYKASQRLLGQRDIETTVESTCRLAKESLDLQMVGVGLVTENRLTLYVAREQDFENSNPSFLEIELIDSEIDHDPIVEAIRTNQAIVLNQLKKENIHASWHQKMVAPTCRSLAIIPLSYAENVLGTLNLYSIHANYFTPHQMQMVQSFATQAAFAINNAQILYDSTKQADELAVLMRLGQVVTSGLNIDTVLQTTYEGVGELMDNDAFWISTYKVGDEYSQYLIKIDLGENLPLDEFSLNSGVGGYVLRTGESVLSDIVSIRKKYAKFARYGGSKQVESVLCIPLKIGNQIIGAMSTQSYTPDAYSEADLKLLTLFGQTVATALENARLFEAEHVARKQAEALQEKLQIYTIELEQSNRELRDFTHISTHDLQEPLRKIQILSNRLQGTYQDKLDQRGQEYLTRLHGSAKRMHTLLRDSLAFSQISNGPPSFSPVNLAQVMNDVLSDLEISIQESQALIHVDSLPIIEADATQIRQLFQNLISNAIKFRQPGKRPIIDIISSLILDEISNIETCQIKVTDNGIGFDEKYLDRIFTFFQRLHQAHEYEGSGIGLTICRKVVEQHKGTITAHSKIDQGATFIITLPVKHA